MIERFYLKDYLSFNEVELELKNGLIVFTGPSGSGKSILMNSILSSLGASSCEASLCESSVTWELDLEETGIEEDDVNVFKHIKKEKSRYFINNQSVSKKVMSDIGSNYLRHLSLRDYSDFENENLLCILDNRVEHKTQKLDTLKKEYRESFLEYKKVKQELEKIEEEEKKIIELKEFAAFEIQKIQEVNPKEGEDEELLSIKKELSKKEKVLESIELAKSLFDNEHHVLSTLDLLDADSAFFDDAMNELRVVLDNAEEKFGALEDIEVEEVLNRIEELGAIKRRYGSIQEALAYKEQKIKELEAYENIEITKDELVQRHAVLEKAVNELADALSELRAKELKSFNDDLNKYLKDLYLRDAKAALHENRLDMLGKDRIELELNSTALDKISTGEFNRLRLAILALKSEFMNKNGGVLMLDEIDANLSGEESMSVAKVLRKLAKYFQIFVISHQPQLTSMGNQHFLIHKKGDESFAKELDLNSRIEEIARIISGESITKEARQFAKELLEASR
ncbi:AAA family ATPase [Sulfurimonas sp. HSL-1716]|uniref:AAA family ATPase n=1 Tax=Hydrocurvibacter sulfurireducens TaxID=3131937 RepID=UPI0031F94012